MLIPEALVDQLPLPLPVWLADEDQEAQDEAVLEATAVLDPSHSPQVEEAVDETAGVLDPSHSDQVTAVLEAATGVLEPSHEPHDAEEVEEAAGVLEPSHSLQVAVLDAAGELLLPSHSPQVEEAEDVADADLDLLVFPSHEPHEELEELVEVARTGVGYPARRLAWHRIQTYDTKLTDWCTI